MTEQHDYNMRTLVTTGADGFYRLVMEGAGNLRDLREVLTQLAVFPDTKKELWIISDLTLDISTQEIIGLADLVKSNPQRPDMVAIVADNDLLFGLSRVFSGHREDRQTQVQVFRSETNALDWLNKSETSLPAVENISADAWQYFRLATPASGSNNNLS
jgi:hypothetical protein